MGNVTWREPRSSCAIFGSAAHHPTSGSVWMNVHTARRDARYAALRSSMALYPGKSTIAVPDVLTACRIT